MKFISNLNSFFWVILTLDAVVAYMVYFRGRQYLSILLWTIALGTLLSIQGALQSSIVFIILYTGLFLFSAINLLIAIYKATKQKYNGLLFGWLFAVTISGLAMISIYAEIEAHGEVFFLLFVIASGILFKSGLKSIETLYAAQAIFWNIRLHEAYEGLTWWFPSILKGELKLFFMENTSLALFENVEAITLSNGLKFKKSPIVLIYKLLPGKLSKVMDMGPNMITEIKTVALDIIRNSVILISASITKEKLDEKYSGLDLLLIMDSIKLMKRIVLNGAFFESHQLFPELSMDDLYIHNVCKKYDEIHGANSLVSQENKLKWFTQEKASSLNVPVFTEEQWNILITKKETKSLPKRGLFIHFYEHGVKYVKISFETFQLEDDLAQEIKEQRQELVQQSKELIDTDTMLSIVKKILEASNYTITFEEAQQVAMLKQKTPNYKKQVIQVVGAEKSNGIITFLDALKGDKDD